ncbi:AAA family ATPase [Clostridium tyrobutyricum]|uniref:AAA family ATPase n=1 Tax=Clostridium tyrobutyricum TaxID=1519 RepID=UPI001C39102B|nr:AAA family ATPase [Clostridium tyrobutyricum]
MKREVAPEEIIYDFNVRDIDLKDESQYKPEYEDIYRKINTAFSIDKQGYNLYIVEDFSKNKLEDIAKYIDKIIKNREIYDICYVIYKDIKSPEVIVLKSGYGAKLKYFVEEIQKLYFRITYEFYNGSDQEKEFIIENIRNKKNDLIEKMMDIAKKDNFTLKSVDDGFVFIPLKEDGNMMNEKEYNLLNFNEKENIINKVALLKNSSQEILDKLKDIEINGTEKIKILMDHYYSSKTVDIKDNYLDVFSENENVLKFLNYICSTIEKRIKDIYSIEYKNDENTIKQIIFKYSVNVIVDNSGRKYPPVIFEEDPSAANLIGNIEYRNKDGNYITDISLIKAGSILKANGGCLILRANSLLNNPNAYYYLKKSLISEKVKLDYKTGYLEVLSLSGLSPEPVKFKEKVILIGDYSTYDLLYNYDTDFKKIFKIRSQYSSILDMNKIVKKSFLAKIIYTCKKNCFKPVTDDGIKEIAKILSRKTENKEKIFIDDYEIERILTLSDSSAREAKRNYIDIQDIENAVYTREMLEKQIDDSFREEQIFIDIDGKSIGQINGLSILSTGYFSFGRPVRITCSCMKGEGNIVDVQRESSLSGKIHNKAINIIRGYINNNIIGGYDKLPVNFHLNFEQVYGPVDGDSASVAEVVSIISSFSKIGIKQNIAVTGSINQFGRVQPIGGVNEKIEGFFNTCKILGETKGKGVLVPASNVKGIALKNEVEQEIKNGNFHIYSMETVEDAVDILMGDENLNYSDVISTIKKECRKYYVRQEKNRHK